MNSEPQTNPASSIAMGPPRVDPTLSIQLSDMKLKAKYGGDLSGAIVSAGYYARKLNETMYVYEGNSYMNRVFRVSSKKSEYLNSINNTGDRVISVTPGLTVSYHDLER